MLTRTRVLPVIGLLVIGTALAAFGIAVGEADDAPGAAVLGLAALIATVFVSYRIARTR